MSDNKNLQTAKDQADDEFFTKYEDIQKEISHYTLKGKVVYCPADDPEISQFWKYFRDNYHSLGLSGLISTHLGGFLTKYNGTDSSTTKISSGDFRDCGAILKTADVVITNPPFSLFRDFVAFLVSAEKDFILLGALNNITYKDIFPLIQDRKVHLGINSGSFSFTVPENGSKKNNVKEGVAKFGNICWYTTIKPDVSPEPLILTKSFSETEYPIYDNYPARDVGAVRDIPCDYYDPLGVPVTFLQYWNPDQFQILGNLGSYGVDRYSLASAIYINGKKKFKRILIRRIKEGF